MLTRPRLLSGTGVPAGPDVWGDRLGQETAKADEEEDLVSDSDDEDGGEDTCATRYTGVKLDPNTGKYGVKILFKERGKRKQQRLGGYTTEEEAAFAYAAGAFVLRPSERIPNTVSLSAAEKATLRGCTKEDLQTLVEARKWWRWRSWREALESVGQRLKRVRKRGGATGASKRRRVVDHDHIATNDPAATDNAESGGTAPVTNEQGGGARDNDQEERREDTGAEEETSEMAAELLTMPRGRLSNGNRGAPLPKSLSFRKKGKEVVQPEEDDGTGAESADSSERSEDEDEEGGDTSASGSGEESAEPAKGGKTDDDGRAGPSAANADTRANHDVDGLVGPTRWDTVDANSDDVRIPSRILEQLIQAQDKSAKENARLEALFLNAMSRPSSGSHKRKATRQRDPGQGCMNPKRKRGETWSGGSDDDGEDDDDDTHGSGGRHMRTAKSPILQRALEHLPADKAWKRVCELARVHMFLNRPTSMMTFYPSSDDKTHGVCAVLDRLPHSFACLALAADKSRRADLNKTLSEWKTRAAARVRDIALPKLGLFRDDRDASSPWAPEKERSIEKIRERIGFGADPPETLVLTTWAIDRDGMPFASRAFATCAKAAFRPKKAGLVMTLKVYHLAWLEHVVSDCVLYWEQRKGRLSNSAGGNAHVVDGLKVLVKEAVERAIRIRNPEYDAEREAWIWGRHGLRISACGLEHMRPAGAAQPEEPVGDDDLSASVGDE
ncbi:unnamed protein product [Closterium sp. NIES-65]|nr:unnamed protein product [Closterium sp. NIES-65]